MTKELRLEECVNLLNNSSSGSGGNSSSSFLLSQQQQKKVPDAQGESTLQYQQQIANTPGRSSIHHQYQQHSSPFSRTGSMIRKSSKNDVRGGHKCTIRLLDDNEILECEFQSHHKGQFLMDFVCRQLNIAEKDYFGLRYVDSNKQRHWLDLGKSIIKQLKDNAYILCFRIKFYPNDPMLLKEEVSRYQLVLQLRRDVLHGRLYSTLSDMATIVSFILQSELGDFDPDVHIGNYAADYELVARQSPELEEKSLELHQKLRGLTPSEADILFLKKASSLDTYGVDPHPVKVRGRPPLSSSHLPQDQQGEQVYIGINHTGISTFQGSRKSTHFKWTQITKLNYEAKMFIIHLSIAEDSRTKKKETVGFKCQTASSCKFLWRCAVEQRLFFNCGCATEIPSSVRGGGIFGSRFRYHGRVQREILEDPGPLRASDAVIQRTPLYRSLQRNKARSLPHSPSHIGYGSLPRSNHSAPSNDRMDFEGAMMGALGSSTSLPLSTLSSPYCPEHTLPLLETLQEDSPRMEDKGRGVTLSRNGSIRSNVSTISEDAEPDLTFLRNRVTLPNPENNLDLNETLMSISEEIEEPGNEKRSSLKMNNLDYKTIDTNPDTIEGKNIKSLHGNGHVLNQENISPIDDNEDSKKGEPEFLGLYNTSSGLIIADDRMLRDSKIDEISSQSNLSSLGRGGRRSTLSCGGIISIGKVFIVCFICVLLALLFVAILSIEVDIDICRRMRRIPEVEYFQLEIYQPIKNFIRAKLNLNSLTSQEY